MILTQNNGTGVSGYSRLEAAEKVVYLTIQDSNEKWAGRKLRGFPIYLTLHKILDGTYYDKLSMNIVEFYIGDYYEG